MPAERRSEAALLQVVDGFYAAALDQQSWTSALRTICAYFGGVGGVVFQLDRRTGQVADWVDYGLEQGRDDYAAYAHSINPRMKFSLAQPAGHIAWEARFISKRQIERHEFYEWLRQQGDLRYFMGSRLFDLGETSVFTSVEFTRKHGHAAEQDIATYDLLARHIANAWRLRNRADAEHRELDRIVFATDAIPWGVLVLDETGRVVEINREAERILAAGDGLRLESGCLRAGKAAANRTLQALIGDATAAARRESFDPGGALVLDRPSGLPGYGVQVIPCLGTPEGARARAAVVLYITDLANSRGISPAELRALFGLSAREADLAVRLARGLSLNEAADRMQISRNTARNHLQNVFAKTSTNSQSELIRLMMKFLPR